LARDPTVGVPLTEFGHLRAFTFEGRYIFDIPTIVVIYEFDQDIITIQSARFQDPKVGRTGSA
jgi:hypothetical protein